MKKFIFFITYSVLFCQPSVDGVVAIVGNREILKSELIQQAQFSANQAGIDPSSSPYLFEDLVYKTLDSMVDQLVLLVLAERDTTVFVGDDEVERVLEQQVSDFILKAGSEEALEGALGVPIRQIKNEYRSDIFDMLLGERFQYKLLGGVGVTKKEVESFYFSFKDSLPTTPSSTVLSLIELPVSISQSVGDSVVLFLEGLVDRVERGESFVELAKQFSDDSGSAFLGGDLGYTLRGTFVKEYESVAYSLNIGETSKPFKSQFGYHIVQLLDRQGEKIHSRHILKIVAPSQKDNDLVLSELESVYRVSLSDPGLFDSLAVEYSREYKNNSAVNKEFENNQLPPKIQSIVSSLDEFSLSSPFPLTDKSYAVVYVYKKYPGGKLTLQESWETIRGYAKNEKQSRVLGGWLDGARSKVYIKKFEL